MEKSGKKWVKMNFRGRTQRSLDPKGRFMLSPEYRESLLLRMQKSENTLFLPQNAANAIMKENEISEIKTDEKSEIKVVVTTYDS